MSAYALSQSHRQLTEGHLKDTDPEVDQIIKDEIDRQQHSIVLIASENFTTTAVFDALGTPCVINILKVIQVLDIMVVMNILIEWNFCVKKEL